MASDHEASQYVGIELHRRRSVIVRKDTAGAVLEQLRIYNDSVAFACAIETAGPNPEVALDATYGWNWAADVSQACGAKGHVRIPQAKDRSGRGQPRRHPASRRWAPSRRIRMAGSLRRAAATPCCGDLQCCVTKRLHGPGVPLATIALIHGHPPARGRYRGRSRTTACGGS
jgi:hypothetical protein